MKRRKFLSLLLSGLIFSVLAKTGYTIQQAIAQEIGFLNLKNTLYKLKVDKKLTIGYIGGSITVGVGASDWKNSYRELTTQWFKQQFPDAEIVEINAAWSGTTSELGAHRTQQHFLTYNPQHVPDLVFVEFAVNDYALATSVDETEQKIPTYAMEGIVRQIWQKNPKADIVFIYTTTEGQAKSSYDNNQISPSIIAHERVADYYHIPSINVGKVLWEKVKNEEGNWKQYLPDTVHPNDAGYKVYTDEIVNFLREKLENRQPPLFITWKKLPLVQSVIDYSKARLKNAWEIEDRSGWTLDNQDFQNHPNSISSSTEGQTLTFNFKGTQIGVLYQSSPEGGIIESFVDGKPYKEISTKSHVPMGMGTAIARELSPGEHTLLLKIKKNPNGGSKVKIGAFMIFKQ